MIILINKKATESINPIAYILMTRNFNPSVLAFIYLLSGPLFQVKPESLERTL